jgi:hypothetical protein
VDITDAVTITNVAIELVRAVLAHGVRERQDVIDEIRFDVINHFECEHIIENREHVKEDYHGGASLRVYCQLNKEVETLKSVISALDELQLGSYEKFPLLDHRHALQA